MKIKYGAIEDAQALSEFYRKNDAHFAKWEPLREPDYHSKQQWQQRLKKTDKTQAEGSAVYILGYAPHNSEIIACCSLTNIILGAFQACHLGYAISKIYEGKGLMKQLCLYTIDHAFNNLNLNRVMANYMPINTRSANLLQTLGFTIEGNATSYLKINGKWEDHVLTSLVNPNNV